MPNSANFTSGKKGYVFIVDEDGDGGTDWPFDSWTKEDRTKLVSRNNFRSGGKDEWIPGFDGFDVTLEGPYATGNPLSIQTGVEYTVYFGIDADGPIEFVGVCIFEKIRKENKAEDGPKWVITGMSQGDFDPVS